MVEPEVAFIDSRRTAGLAEDFVSSIVQRVLHGQPAANSRPSSADIAALETISEPFYRLTYTQAADILRGPTAPGFIPSEIGVSPGPKCRT